MRFHNIPYFNCHCCLFRNSSLCLLFSVSETCIWSAGCATIIIIEVPADSITSESSWDGVVNLQYLAVGSKTPVFRCYGGPRAVFWQLWLHRRTVSTVTVQRNDEYNATSQHSLGTIRPQTFQRTSTPNLPAKDSFERWLQWIQFNVTIHGRVRHLSPRSN